MKIPKYIDEALKRRTKAAKVVDNNDFIIGTFIYKNSIDVDMCDYFGGVEIYVNPTESEERIRQAIQEHEQ